MLSDCFAEQAICSKADREFYLRMLLVFVTFLMAVVIFLGLNPLLGFLVFMITIWLFIVFIGYHKKEFEYTLTNGNIEIAAIYKQVKRKELMHFGVDQIMMVVKEDSDRIQKNEIVKKRNYTSKRKNTDKIALVVDINKKKQLVLLEPNERVLNHIKTYAKNKCYDI